MGNERETDHMDAVDVHSDVHRATEPDEEQVLRELYGAPDADEVEGTVQEFEGPPPGPLPWVDPSAYGPDSVPLDDGEGA